MNVLQAQQLNNINKYNNINFKANIIDVHVHRGTEDTCWHSRKFPTKIFDTFIKQPLNITINNRPQIDNVEKVLVSSIDGLAWNEITCQKNKQDLIKHPEQIEFIKNEIDANIDMINKYKKDKFYSVIAICQPTKTKGSANNIRKLMKENPRTICGLKLHPYNLMLKADSHLYDDYLLLANEFNLPCLFHSHVNIENGVKSKIKDVSDPEYIYKLGRRFPNVPIIMGHMGEAKNELGHQHAIDIFKQSIKNNDAKLFVDISWVDFHNDLPSENPRNVIKVIEEAKRLGKLDRILFGTDAPFGCFGEATTMKRTSITAKEAYELMISRTKTAIKKHFKKDADEIINKIFYENAKKIFFKR